MFQKEWDMKYLCRGNRIILYIKKKIKNKRRSRSRRGRRMRLIKEFYVDKMNLEN